MAEQLTGWTLADAHGRHIEDVFKILNQETRKPAPVPVNETLAEGTIQGLANHTILVSRDGSERSISDSCAPIRDHSNKIIGAVLIFRDVTEAYKIEQELKDSSVLIQTILNKVVDGIFTMHAVGGIIETMNPAAERMFGYPIEELYGLKISTLIPELNSEQNNCSLEYYGVSDESKASGIPREVIGLRKNGTTFPLEIFLILWSYLNGRAS